MFFRDEEAARAYTDALPVEDLIGQLRTFIGRYESAHGPVTVNADEQDDRVEVTSPRSDAELVAEAKRALADLGAL